MNHRGTILTAIFAFMVGLVFEVTGQSIDELLEKGRLDAVADSLSRRATAERRDGNTLYYQSFLETDAERSLQLLMASLNSGVESRYQESIYLKLAQIYLLKRDYRKLTEVINDYRARFEKGRHRFEMMRLSALADEIKGRHETALRQIDRYLGGNVNSIESQWGVVDKARVMRKNKKGIGADKMLRRLSKEKKGPGVSQALYLRSIEAIRQGRIDDAVFLYNLLREAFPRAVGLDAIVKKIGSLEVAGSENTAEQLTGTFYSVKVGVFKNKSNARRQADMFRGYDRKIEIKNKKIKGQKYYVVYVGRFTDWDESVSFKNRLEASHDDVYQVVAR